MSPGKPSFFVRYETVAACGLAALGSILPGLCYLAGGYTLVWRDTAKLFQPLRAMINESLRDLHLPLWNPHEALGIPLLAQMMHGVLNPVSFLSAFLMPHAGLDISILIHTALAAAGSALLARTLGLSAGASMVAGVSYGLSGYLLGMGSIIQYLYGAAYAPWAMAGIRAAGEGRRFGIPSAAIAVSVILFAGDPQWAIVAIILGLALALEAGGRSGIIRAALGVFVGSLIAAVQLIPTYVFLQKTPRGGELDILDRLQWALSPWRLIEFVAPGFFGSPGMGLERWPVFAWLGGYARSGFQMPFAPGVYVGGATMVLAFAGARGSRISRIMALSSLFFLWLSLGNTLGSEQLMHFVPVWGKFRYAEKMVGPLTLCLSLLAAIGADRLSEYPSRSLSVISGVLGGVSLLAALILGAWQGFESLFTGPAAVEAVPILRRNLAAGLAHAGLAFTAISLLIAISCKWRGMRRGFTRAAAFIVFIQLLSASTLAIHGGLRNMLDDSSLKRIRASGEPTRIVTPLERNYLYPEGFSQFDAQIGIQSRLGAPCYNVAAGIDQIDTYTGLRPGRLELLLNAFSDRFGVRSVSALRRYSVTHMMIKDPYFPDEIEVAQAASAGGARVMDNREWGFMGWRVPHRPWAFFAGSAVVAQGEREALESLLISIGRGDPTVVLENATLPKALSPGKILSFRRDNGFLRIEADAGDGVLVVNDSWWPGWRAFVDGREVPVWRADYLVRAVPWPAGRHILEMRYDPKEVSAGLILSGTGIIALFVTLIVAWRKRFSNEGER